MAASHDNQQLWVAEAEAWKRIAVASCGCGGNFRCLTSRAVTVLRALFTSPSKYNATTTLVMSHGTITGDSLKVKRSGS